MSLIFPIVYNASSSTIDFSVLMSFPQVAEICRLGRESSLALVQPSLNIDINLAIVRNGRPFPFKLNRDSLLFLTRIYPVTHEFQIRSLLPTQITMRINHLYNQYKTQMYLNNLLKSYYRCISCENGLLVRTVHNFSNGLLHMSFHVKIMLFLSCCHFWKYIPRILHEKSSY
jgi:hypothetical protein